MITITRFATVDLAKAGWMMKEKGIWSATEIGKGAFERFTDPVDFYKRAVQLYHDWKAYQPEGEVVDEIKPEMLAPTPSQAFEEAERAAWAEIWDHLQRIDPHALQRLVAGLLEAMGYHVSCIAPPGNDGGMDVLAWTDPLGTRPPRIKTQVKRRKDHIAVDGRRPGGCPSTRVEPRHCPRRQVGRGPCRGCAGPAMRPD